MGTLAPLAPSSWTWMSAAALKSPLSKPSLKSGAPVVSTVQLQLAADGSWLPAGSVATTVKLWSPLARPVYVLGDVQAEVGAPSRLQAKDEPVSVAWNVKEALELATVPLGPESMIVSGAVWSTVTPWASEAVLSELSTARAVTVAGPSGAAVESQAKA